MATKDFIVKNGLDVAGNITTSGSLTLGGKTVSRLIDSDEVVAVINENATGFTGDSDSIHRMALKSNPISQADSRALSIGKKAPLVQNSQVGDFFIGWDSEETIYQLREASSYNTDLLSVGSFSAGSLIYTSGTPSGANNATTPTSFPSPIGSGTYARSFHSNHSSGGGYPTFTFSTPTPVVYFYVTGSDPNFRIQRINYENGDYALNASNSNPSFQENITWYGTTNSKSVNGNGSFDARHPDDASIKVTSIQFRGYDRSWVNYYWVFMSAANEWVPTGRIFDSDHINKIITENSSGFATSSFDSDQIVAIINENTSAGSIDSDVAAIAQLRRDADSDSIVIQAIQTQVNTLPTSSFDSDQVVAIIQENPGSQSINVTAYTFTSTANDSEFSGSDDNGLTLSYIVDRIHVYLNGILLTNNTDYTATDASTVTLVNAPDSDDVLTIVKYLGTVQTGFDSDQVVAIINENVVSGSVDSDVAAIAQLRRDADSDSIRIQEIATSLEQINELVDSDLKAIADLRNDLDSESIRIASLASSGGVTVTEVTDSDGREAISSPSEGDIAVQWGSSAGINTGVTYDFGGSALFSFDVPYQPSNYSSAEATLSNATFAAAAQVGDVIAVQNSTIRYYVHPNYYTDQGTSTGTLMMVVVQVVNSTTLKVAFRNTIRFPAQSSSGYLNTDMYNYFGDPANPRGDIPSGALIAGPTVGNTFNYWSSKQWIGGLATLYRMFDANTKSAYGENPTATPHAYNDDYTGTATPLPNSNPNVYIRNDSVWQTYIDQQITTTVDSDYVHARIDSEYINSLGFIYNTDITEVTDSDQRVAINNPKEGDIAVQFRAGTGQKTNISYDFGGANLWSKTVYLANGTLGLTYVTASDVGNGRFKWSHATFDDHVQKGDVIVVENATLTTSPGVNPWASRSGTFLFTCHTPKIGGTAPWYNIAAYAYVQSQGSTTWLNSDISGYFGDASANVNTTNPRGSIPAAAQMVHSYGNINNSSATTSLSGGVATLYRMFSADTYQDAYDTSGGSGSVYVDHTGNAVGQGYLKPLIYHHDGSNFRSYIEDHILGTIDSDYVSARAGSGSVDSDVAVIAQLRRDADSDSIRIQEIATSLEQINELVDSDLKAIADIRNDVDSDSVKIQAINTELTGLELEILGVNASLNAKIDSDSARIDALAAAGGSLTTFAQVVHTFTTTQPTTIFTGADDDGDTLSYTVGKLQVYLNGLLLTPGASKDYTATNGTSVVLTEASDSEDVITIVKYLGAADDILTQKYVYKVASSGNHTLFDSEFTGADENGNVLSYTPNKVQVFLNGILLQDSDDYIANNGSTITLLAAPDSDDVLVVYRYLGTQVTGFDSDQVVAIINENASTLPWVEKTSSTSITVGQKVIVDTSTAVTLTLPSSASLGDEIRIIDGTGNAATNNITVARNGHNIMGAASDLIINLNASGIGLVYYNASRGWILIEN